jgi:hypothetical protein
MGRRSSIGVLACACIAVVIAMSGCGGGSSSSTTTHATHNAVAKFSTRAQFARQLDAVCSQADRLASRQAALTQAINASDLPKASEIVTSTESEVGPFYRRFVRLIPSAQDRVAFVRYQSLTHEYLRINERLAAALHDHLAVEVQRFGGFALKLADQSTSAAVALGLAKCGARR